MTALAETGLEKTSNRVEYHPVRDMVEVVRDMPQLGKTALRELVSLVTHGNLPEQPAAHHGEHVDMFLHAYPEVDRSETN